MRLHHLTTTSGLAAIEAAGAIIPTWPKETSVSFPERVVWLTADPNPATQGWSGGAGREPLTARITVDVDDAVPWDEWKRGKRPETVSALERSARGWGGDPSCWHLVGRSISEDEWVAVETFEPPPPPTAVL